MIERILHIWSAGGWVMWPLLALALMMFFTAVRLWRNLAARQYRRLPEETWKLWVRKPEKGEGEVGEIIRYALEEARSTRDINSRFAEVTALTLPPIDRQLQLLGTFVAAAPLVGLLGTVFGMLVTFQALAAGGGGGKVTEAMAAGISQALFPPEVGLCIALPGLVFIQVIRRQRRELEAFLAHLESYAVQWFRTKAVCPQAAPAATTAAPGGDRAESPAALSATPVAA
ncbi:MAG: MotA/TolQ/ExbB proton channel family protein [Verrucomicrobiae bacterium]|nr:MotA/TolQ/ExbB proton channel family protein [Verrucomicrobiae bacterium]